MSQSEEPLVLLERHTGYAVITLNRPAKRNAMNGAAQGQLLSALAATEADCAAIVLTGAGDIAFCAGVDLSERRGLGAQDASRQFAWGSDSWFEVQERILRHPAVFVAAVNGFALGGGLTLVNNCELAVASRTAQFGMPELGLGTFPALAGPSTYHRLLPKHAAQMIFTAERVDAATALGWGLVNEVVEPDRLLPRACELAERIAGFDPVAVDYSKKAVREIANLDWSRAIEYGLRTGAVIRAQTGTASSRVREFLDGQAPTEKEKP
ncbi:MULTISPECIES: enoyl-CoA hydratase/isomerase family protein [unclassified Mycobacterium]|uniref:enoyl-CoA hydratase/isomerase family protein n=1 Tax=unclassified Mycobacterium TaxID=2642494 RepID=UPI0029C6C156|nr:MULTISPECIES: enoyl-CoA hydratase/isomerase family protein [unclassified Mycobacterium]